MTKTIVFPLAILLTAAAAFAQSVAVATPKHAPPMTRDAAPVTFAAHCATCAERIEGMVTVDRDSVRFCCSSWTKPGSKVAVRCPYSFTLPLNRITAQYFEKEGPAWHVVSRGADYGFVGIDSEAMKAAYERLRTLRNVPSLFANRFERELAVLQRPAVTTAAECH